MEAAYHFCWLEQCATRVAIEQPPTLLELIVRPPDVRTSVSAFGCPRSKQWWWFLTNLPGVPPSDPVPAHKVRSEHHLHDHLPSELRSIARAATPPSLAAAHVKAWHHVLDEPRRLDRPVERKALVEARRQAASRLVLLAASRFAPR